MIIKNIVLKLCYTPWNNASRDKRELSACRELGLEPLVMAAGVDNDWYREDFVSGFRVLRFTTKPLGNVKRFNRITSMFTWAWGARKLKPAIISGHDIRGLFIGWLSTVGIPKSKRPRLVYDSHEFELGRNIKRSERQLMGVKYLERFLMKRCAFSIMVNDAIADEVQKIHKLKERPIVVRSTPNYWTVDPQVCQQVRGGLLAQMGDPREMLLMYHGCITPGRGIEMLLQLTKENPNVCTVVLGYGDSDYLEELNCLAQRLGVADRVLFHNAVAVEELWKYVGAADVGMMLIPAIVKSYLYALPNKFFENIQSETPIICPHYPSYQPIMERYSIGLSCDPTDLAQINTCVERMRTDKEFYVQCKQNLKRAKEDLCWEKEKRVLQDAYQKAMEAR